MLQKIDHVAIAVRSMAEALRVYAGLLGLTVGGVEEIPEQKTRIAMFSLGESRIELLEATSEDSPVAGFIAKRGEGMHHICFQVDDLEGELQKLTEAGLRLIDETPKIGAGGCRIAFLHPSSASGVLIELSEPGPGTHTLSYSE
jgi:methylmalonyl-CoA/ethylmalonyl-CoA epimerase